MKKAKELYEKIRNYPEDTWKDSPEFIELKNTLENNNIETLKENDYKIPNWKKPKKKTQ
jgi:hypothetical protein